MSAFGEGLPSDGMDRVGKAYFFQRMTLGKGTRIDDLQVGRECNGLDLFFMEKCIRGDHTKMIGNDDGFFYVILCFLRR